MIRGLITRLARWWLGDPAKAETTDLEVFWEGRWRPARATGISGLRLMVETTDKPLVRACVDAGACRDYGEFDRLWRKLGGASMRLYTDDGELIDL